MSAASVGLQRAPWTERGWGWGQGNHILCNRYIRQFRETGAAVFMWAQQALVPWGKPDKNCLASGPPVSPAPCRVT